jgi:mono/diheme cytochrome c family protein
MKSNAAVFVKIILLVLGATALYTYIGQLVPQKEVQPPQVVEIAAGTTTEELVDIGKGIADGKGLCLTCHTIGSGGALRYPDLDGIATRAGTRIEGMQPLEYMARSIYEPDSYIVPGFNPGMPAIDKPPIGLTDQEILAVIAYLESLGGTPSVTLEVTKVDLGLE